MSDEQSIALIRTEIPRLAGWMNPCPDRAIQLYQLVRKLKPKILVEIGVFGGRSLIPQAIACRDNGYGHVFGIDPWCNKDCVEGGKDPLDVKWWQEQDLHGVHKGCMEAIWKLGLDKWITIVRSSSQDFAPYCPNMEMLYLDGNHNPVASCRDVQLYLPRLAQNAYLFMDDTDWPQTQDALKLIENQCKLHSDFKTYRIYAKGDPEMNTQTC